MIAEWQTKQWIIFAIPFGLIVLGMLVWMLILTTVFGLAFLGVKYFEYKEKYELHHIPGANFDVVQFINPGAYGLKEPPLAPDAAQKTQLNPGAVHLDPRSVAVDAGRVADEVIAHLAGIEGAELTVTLQIEAAMPKGAENSVLNTVGAASRALDFTTVVFE